MCTISFIPSVENSAEFIFTSNRDEASNRPTLAPEVYTENGVQLLYPKDEIAGGTWIAVSDQQKLICLMNGAEKAHQRQENYRKSRGVVLKDLLLASDFNKAVENYDFVGIEPFTIIYVSWQEKLELQQLSWNGDEEKLSNLPVKPHIWSASMTYTSAMKKERHEWFDDFISKQNLAEITSEKVWKFHHEAGKNDKNIGFIIDRGLLKTTSITQVKFEGNEIKMKFENLLKGETITKLLV